MEQWNEEQKIIKLKVDRYEKKVRNWYFKHWYLKHTKTQIVMNFFHIEERTKEIQLRWDQRKLERALKDATQESKNNKPSNPRRM